MLTDTRRTHYRYMTDFIFVLCKLRVIKKSQVKIVDPDGSNMSHVHDAMHYILTRAFKTNNMHEAVSLSERFRFNKNDKDST